MNGLSGVNFNTGFSSQSVMGYGHVANLENPLEEKKNFKQVMSSMVTNINDQMNKPDDLLTQAATGSGNVDVHDVMVAMSQAEITLSVATTAVTKVIQAYDKIVQIQV